MIAARRSVMAAVAVAVMLVTVTSAGSAAPDRELANCTIDPLEVTVADTGVEVRAAAKCVAGTLVVFQVSLVAEVKGLECKAPKAAIEPNPAPVPTWIKVSLELTCKPAADGKVGSKVSVEMIGLNDVKLAAYGFGDSLVDAMLTNTHGWKVNFVAGVGELPPLGPAGKVSGVDDTGGSTQSSSDHEVS